MRRIKYIVMSIIAVMSIEFVSAQTLNTSYFMEGSYLRTNLNPALTPTRGYVTVPLLGGFTLDMSSNYLSVSNFFYKRGDEVVSALHESVSSEEFLGKLPNNAKMGLGLDMSIFSAGFYKHDMFWNFGLNLHSENDTVLSKDLFAALKTLGNGVYDLSNTSLNSNNYAELYVGTTRDILDWVTVGARVKFLIGICNISADIDDMYANVSADTIEGRLRGTLRMSGAFIDTAGAVAGSEITDDIFGWGGINSFGAGIDLGAEVRLLDNRLRVSAAVTDLGFICWSKKTSVEAVAMGDFHYNGVDIATGETDMAGEIKAVYGDNASKGYTKRLNCSLNIGAEYNILDDRIGFGLLSHTEFCNTMSYTELTASANFRPLHWLSASLSHTFLNRNRVGIFGCAVNIHPSGFNLFVGCDYTGFASASYKGLSIPRNLKSFNIYAGIGFNIGELRKQ